MQRRVSNRVVIQCKQNGMGSRDRRGEKGDASDCTARLARRGRQRASTWLVTAEYDQQVDRRWQYHHSVAGSDRCGCAVARLQPPGLLLAKTKRRQCRCRLDSGGLDSGDPNHGRAAPIPTKRNHGRHGKGSPRDRSRDNLSAGAGRLCFARPKATNRLRKWKEAALQTKSCSFLHRQLERCLGFQCCVAYENSLRDSCCLPSQPGTLESTRHLM